MESVDDPYRACKEHFGVVGRLFHSVEYHQKTNHKSILVISRNINISFEFESNYISAFKNAKVGCLLQTYVEYGDCKHQTCVKVHFCIHFCIKMRNLT